MGVELGLDRRGVDTPSFLCPMCNDCLENIDHVLVRCRVSRLIWEKVYTWWGLEEQISVDVTLLLSYKGGKSWKEESKKI